jgi:hypothetical protein
MLVIRPSRSLRVFVQLIALVGAAAATSAAGCGGSSGDNHSGSSSGASSGASGGSSGTNLFGGSGGGSGGSGGSGSSGSGTVTCPSGVQCNVSCSGGTTSISGVVYDPAGKNPLYNIAVYVPGAPLEALPKGVLTGSDACSCSALFKSGAVVSTTTGVDGSFKLTNAPVGMGVPLVLQVGKWRRLVNINTTQCQDNPQPDKSLTLPSTVAAGDTNDNIPDIAVSTGSADTLECLMERIGLPTSEYVAGPGGGGGHVHVYSGGTGGGGGRGGGGVGTQEMPPMMGAPASDMNLWSSQDQLMPYDITLLSCEGGETYNANPPVLESYLNAGGRVFASHFHYAWFAGPIGTMQNYTAPADWGTNLAAWTPGSNGMNSGAIGGIIDTTLNGSTMAFPKGVALQQWLTNVGALGQGGVPAGELSIFQPRFNAVVSAANTPSQPWITSDQMSGMPGQTMYFSFDTPVNAPAGANGQPAYCGRAVFSDLHVAGDPSTMDNPPPPGGCSTGDLSPQEKALEFMLFDLSSCVIPDTVAPPTSVPMGPVQ